MLLLLLSVLLLLRLVAGLFEPVLLKLPPLLAHGLLVLEVFDLSQYNIDGEHPQYYIGPEKFGTYDKRKNILRIWRNGIPIYENNNGKICKDEDDLADSLL